MFMRLIALALVFVIGLAGWRAGLSKSEFALESTIAFTSSRDNPVPNPFLAGASEIYLVSPDGSNLRRLTDNTAGDAFPTLSPDGKKIVFDSNRNRAEGEPLNTSDLFVMNTDGAEQMFLIRGSSATWSPDSKNIAYHASASGLGLPTRTDAGASTSDSDIFVANVDDLLAGVAGCGWRRNLTNSPEAIDDDADWSPDGRRIVFTRNPVTDDPILKNLAEIYVINVDGTGLTRLTFNVEGERGPSWSPDGSSIVYICRIGGGASDLEICTMNADGSDQRQLTNNTVLDGTPTFSPDGQQIVFQRQAAPGIQQLWLMNADGTGQAQLTNTPGLNLFANWGVVRVHKRK